MINLWTTWGISALIARYRLRSVCLCIAQVLKALGAAKAYCTDLYDKALSVAAEVGIHYPLDIRKTDPVGFIFENTKGQGVDFIFDTVGIEQSQEQALKLLACSGTVVNLVASSRKISYRLMELSGERNIKGSSNNLHEDVLMGIKLMEAGLVNIKPMITHKYPLQEVNHGFETLMEKEKTGATKVLLIP